MKTERRHELQSNVLADWLGKNLILMRQYSRVIVGVLIAVSVVFFATTFILNSQESLNNTAWNLFYKASAARDSDAMQGLAETYPNSSAGLWARQSLADMQLDSGNRQSYTSTGSGEEDIKKAINNYTSVVSEAKEKGLDMIQRRAIFGLGQAFESLNDVEGALKQYERLAEAWPETTLGKAASQRVEHLKDPATQEFYTWFAQQDLRTRPRPTTPNTGIQPPQTYGDLPDNPDLSLPNPDDLSLPISDLSSGFNLPGLENTTPDPTTPTEPADTETPDEKDEPPITNPEDAAPAPDADSNEEENQEENSTETAPQAVDNTDEAPPVPETSEAETSEGASEE